MSLAFEHAFGIGSPRDVDAGILHRPPDADGECQRSDIGSGSTRRTTSTTEPPEPVRPDHRGAQLAASAANDREKALDAALAQIERQFGKGSVMRLGEDGRAPVEVIPTGSIALDVALGIGGLPRGRIVEIYGPESSGKTTVALHAIAEVQAAGGLAAFIDAEHALDPDYLQARGRPRQPLRLFAAGHRRAGAGDLRHPRC